MIIRLTVGGDTGSDRPVHRKGAQTRAPFIKTAKNSNMSAMSVYEASENSIPFMRDLLLEAAKEDCRAKCPVAKGAAYDIAVFIIKEGTSVELVQPKFGDVMSPCSGPSVVAVCGAEEGKPTYECNHDIHKAGGSIISLVKMSL